MSEENKILVKKLSFVEVVEVNNFSHIETIIDYCSKNDIFPVDSDLDVKINPLNISNYKKHGKLFGGGSSVSHYVYKIKYELINDGNDDKLKVTISCKYVSLFDWDDVEHYEVSFVVDKSYISNIEYDINCIFKKKLEGEYDAYIKKQKDDWMEVREKEILDNHITKKMTREDKIKIWSEEIVQYFGDYIDDNGYLPYNWSQMIEDNIPDYDPHSGAEIEIKGVLYHQFYSFIYDFHDANDRIIPSKYVESMEIPKEIPMEFKNEDIIDHVTFGKGVVISNDNDIVRVMFELFEKKFSAKLLHRYLNK